VKVFNKLTRAQKVKPETISFGMLTYLLCLMFFDNPNIIRFEDQIERFPHSFRIPEFWQDILGFGVKPKSLPAISATDLPKFGVGLALE